MSRIATHVLIIKLEPGYKSRQWLDCHLPPLLDFWELVRVRQDYHIWAKEVLLIMVMERSPIGWSEKLANPNALPAGKTIQAYGLCLNTDLHSVASQIKERKLKLSQVMQAA